MKILGIVGLVLFIVLIVIFMPILTIWALNTLFPVLAIPFTIKTWAAALVFSLILSGNRGKREAN